MDSKNLISNLTNCISANYGSAMELKRKIENGEEIKSDDFDLNMIIDRSYLHLSKATEFHLLGKILNKLNKILGVDV